MSAEEELVAELVRMRRGRGLQDRDLRRRLGGQLTRFCGISGKDSNRAIHDKIHGWLVKLSTNLPPDLARAVVIAFAMDRKCQHPKYFVRVEVLAAEQSCAPRTARRHVDHAIRAIAHAALSASPNAGGVDPEKGWHLRKLRSVLRLDTDGPELHETRVVVADRADLRRVAVRLSAPAPDAVSVAERGIAVDVVHGARLVSMEMLHNGQHLRCLLELRPPLQPGEDREFQMIYRLSSGRPIRPHYAMLPLVECDRFELLVRFDVDSAPSVLWRLSGVPPRLLDDEHPGGDRLTVDEAGEVALTFTDLRPGWGYGLKWLPQRHESQ